MIKKLFDLTGDGKFVAGVVATFVTAYSLFTADDILLCCSHYFAGAASAVALFIICDDDDRKENHHAH